MDNIDRAEITDFDPDFDTSLLSKDFSAWAVSFCCNIGIPVFGFIRIFCI